MLVAVRVFMGQRVNLQEKYDYPENGYNIASQLQRMP